MNTELERIIDGQEVWTFKECLGLANDFGLKVRFVIATVYARGKRYID